MTWREYHEATKHSRESLKRTRHVLDWANKPDPFRHYEGVPVLDLPPDPPAPEASVANNGPTFLSQLLFHSAAISAAKRVPSTGEKYALRVNPSSGNLHPTEFHFATRGLREWPDGLYHYRPSAHMSEQRALGDFQLNPAVLSAPVLFILTSIVWREAWKYTDRAYRYCLHDIGHAWQSLTLAAEAMGCETLAIGDFPDDEISRTCKLNEDEWPMLLLEIRGGSIPLREPDSRTPEWFAGQANPLSPDPLKYPTIEAIQNATKVRRAGPRIAPSAAGSGGIPLPTRAPSRTDFGEIARNRRSALDFQGGTRAISLAQLSAILLSATRQFHADFSAANFIQLYLYVHRVEGLLSGVYRLWPERAELEPIKSGDQRVAAAGLSLGQDLAGNACVAFSMIGDLDRAARAYGDRGYRYVHFEAGGIGQRLYLAAEAHGLAATGIGAFYDDEVYHYLDLTSDQRQVIYHFAIGYPIPDSRLEA